MGLARSEEEGVTGGHLRCAVLVADRAAPGNDQVKLGFHGMGMIRTIRFAGRNVDERKIERMALGEIEGIGLAAEGDGDFPAGLGVLSTGRLALLGGNL